MKCDSIYYCYLGKKEKEKLTGFINSTDDLFSLPSLNFKFVIKIFLKGRNKFK
jgi:hypothetical protein